MDRPGVPKHGLRLASSCASARGSSAQAKQHAAAQLSGSGGSGGRRAGPSARRGTYHGTYSAAQVAPLRRGKRAQRGVLAAATSSFGIGRGGPTSPPLNPRARHAAAKARARGGGGAGIATRERIRRTAVRGKKKVHLEPAAAR